MDNSQKNPKKDIEEMYSNVLFVADLPNETTNDDLKKIQDKRYEEWKKSHKK